MRAETLDGLAELTEKLVAAGVEDLVLDPAVRTFGASLAALTQLRRLALKKNFRPLGYPIIAFPYLGTAEPGMEMLLAGQQIAKYAGFVVLSRFEPAEVYPLLVLRANLFTDPQKPIQVEPGIYEINKPTADSPVLVTTNFSITYFAVANEMESSGQPAWLIVADAEGMSVLTAWAAGKFDAEKIAKSSEEHGRCREGEPPQGGHPGARGRADGRAGRRAARLADQGRPARGGGPAAVPEDRLVRAGTTRLRDTGRFGQLPRRCLRKSMQFVLFISNLISVMVFLRALC